MYELIPRERTIIVELQKRLDKLACPKTNDTAKYNHETKLNIWIKLPKFFIGRFVNFFSVEDGYCLLSYTPNSSHADVALTKDNNDPNMGDFLKHLNKFIKKLKGKGVI